MRAIFCPPIECCEPSIPRPTCSYIDFDEIQRAGASPETLVSLKNSKLSTFPIAGTCPRGETPEQDAAFIAELLKDEKN